MTDFTAVPAALRAIPSWRTWRGVEDATKLRKPPCGPDGRKLDEWPDEKHDLTFDQAQSQLAALQDAHPGATFGLGLVRRDPWIFVDLDREFEVTSFRNTGCYVEGSVTPGRFHAIGRAEDGEGEAFEIQADGTAATFNGFMTITGKEGAGDPTVDLRVHIDNLKWARSQDAKTQTPNPKPLPPNGAAVLPGGQEPALFRELSALRARGLSEAAGVAAMWAEIQGGRFPNAPGREAWTRRDVEDKARHVWGRYPEGQEEAHVTDPGNAEVFAEAYRDCVRYDADRRRWLLFNGHRWEPDALARVRLLVLEALRSRQAAVVAGNGDDRKARLRGLVAAENRVPQILGAAEPYLGTRATDWDADTWVVGAPNGTVDIRTGEVRSGKPEDRITKQLGAPWDKAARSELWESVLEHALPDPKVRAFLQQLAGLTLAGLTGENVLPLIYGVTRSSKGTVLDAIKSALGDYARAADLSTLARRRFEDGSAPRPDLVDLVGARIVAIYEAGRRFKLDTALVKSLSGSDPIKARTLHEKPIEFRPTFLIWLATDTRPEAPEDDAAFYERLCELPFNVYLPAEKRDPQVRRALATSEHGTAVLAWAWHGLQAYLESKRLVRPKVVEDAGRAYRDAMDPVRPFTDECCAFEPGAWTAAEDLRREYERWCRENGERPASGKRVGETLRKNGCTVEKRGSSSSRGWAGVRVHGTSAQASRPEPYDPSAEPREPGVDDGLPF